MEYAKKIVGLKHKENPIESFLTGYWENDIWYVYDVEMKRFITNQTSNTCKKIDFTTLSHPLRNEVKYYFAYRLTNDTISVESIFDYTSIFKRINEFVNIYYLKITSIIDIPYDEAVIKWRMFLEEKGLKTVTKQGYKNHNITFFSQLHKFIYNLYDERDEYEKDVWDCRKIPGAKIIQNKADYLLNFKNIPLCFRDMSKRYIKLRSTTNSHSQCVSDIMALRLFLNNIQKQEPEWSELTKLTRLHIENFLTWYAGYTKGWQYEHIKYLLNLRIFLEYIQKAQYPEAPEIPTVCLIYKEDFPRRPYKNIEDIKYIPESVIAQFEENIENIRPSYYQAVAIVLRASGWRISDVLSLKYDTCLEHTTKGWYLHGDIPKVSVLNHRIPITDEVAAAIKTFSDQIKLQSNDSNNPDHLLFVCFRGKRKGNCYRGQGVQSAFNRLANEYDIIDDEGKIFYFGNHAFRHTKAVELINNGMNILHVQKWMAHASPEMTIRYAKILDDTMRKSWEEAMKNGIFRIDHDGKVIPININDVIDEDLIEWEYIKNNLDAVRMPLGYCMKPKKQDCHTQLNPCLTCRSLCTTIDFIPQYEQEICEIKQLIETGMKLGREMWVEKNKYLLHRYEEILSVLKTGKTHHSIGKKGREYVGGERNDCRQS